MNLTPEQYKELNSIYPKFHSVISVLEKTVKPEIVAEIVEMQQTFYKVFADKWKSEDEAFDKNYQALSEIADANGLESIWSVSEVPATDLDKVFTKEKKVIITYSSWGNPVEYVLENKGDKQITWLEMWRVADKVIKMSGDDHHVFVEAFRKVAKGKYQLICGS